MGGVLAVFGWTGIVLGFCVLFGLDASVATTAIAGLLLFGTAALLGAVVSPLLDDTDSPVAWLFSVLVKWVQSPLLTTVGLGATLIVASGSNKVDFRRGMLFIAVGPGDAVLTLGAVAWTQSGRFNPDGTVPDSLARHESVHSRTVAALGELGFYGTYVTIGAIWGWRGVTRGTTSPRPAAATRLRRPRTRSPVTRPRPDPPATASRRPAIGLRRWAGLPSGATGNPAQGRP